MEHLYTPWRMAYIRSEKKPVDGCIFCNLPHDAEANLVIARKTHLYVTLNRYPYNNGHLMVIPYEHVATPEQLSVEVLTEQAVTINQCLHILRAVYRPSGFNLGANLGTAAGAGIAEHYHFHIVPRWDGDANFMSTIGATRVIPDTLENTYRELKTLWDSTYPA